MFHAKCIFQYENSWIILSDKILELFIWNIIFVVKLCIEDVIRAENHKLFMFEGFDRVQGGSGLLTLVYCLQNIFIICKIILDFLIDSLCQK